MCCGPQWETNDYLKVVLISDEFYCFKNILFYSLVISKRSIWACGRTISIYVCIYGPHILAHIWTIYIYGQRIWPIYMALIYTNVWIGVSRVVGSLWAPIHLGRRSTWGAEPPGPIVRRSTWDAYPPGAIGLPSTLGADPPGVLGHRPT